jgi:hypothetical protein
MRLDDHEEITRLPPIGREDAEAQWWTADELPLRGRCPVCAQARREIAKGSGLFRCGCTSYLWRPHPLDPRRVRTLQILALDEMIPC